MITAIKDAGKFDRLATHITQSWAWGNFRSQTPTVKKVLRLGSFDKGNLKRVFQVFFHKIPHISDFPYLPNSIAYLPRCEMPNQEELAEIKKICLKENALFLKVEPLNNLKFKTKNLKFGKPILPQHSIFLDLTLPEDKILANMHEKTRYNIHLAGKKGVIVKEEHSPAALENFINLLEKTESRQGFYSHYPDYYRKLWQTLYPAKIAFLLNAYLPNTNLIANGQSPVTPIASIMLFSFKDTLYYPYGGSDSQYRNFMAPHLLHWEAIKLGKKLRCKTYDLWGSYKNSPTPEDPWWGIYRFKSSFGGKEITLPETIDIPLSFLYPFYSLADSLRWSVLKFLKTPN